MRRRVTLFVLAAALTVVASFAGEARLQEGDFVAVCGDSIAEQRLYSAFIEEYLLVCQPAAKLRVMQFGRGGETSWGFRGKMANDCVPFNQDLNRFRLVVRGELAGRVKVSWGKASKELPAAELAKGINLAAEFLDNPFCAQFQRVSKAIRAQQRYETPLIKDLIHRIPGFKRMVPEEAEAFARIRQGASKRGRAPFDAAAAAVVPVRHTIRIEAP